jgi:hypothetical protein
LRTVLLSLALIGVAACAIAGEDVGGGTAGLRPVERSIVGRGIAYDADLGLVARTDELHTSQKARRGVAWKAVAKVLAPTSLAETAVAVDGTAPKLPAFRTWYQKDDLERMFARLYEAHGADNRRARRPFAATTLDQAFADNATDRGPLTADEYLARITQVTTAPDAQGLGGNARVSYSPGALRHLLGQWAGLSRCARGLVADDPTADPISPTNFTTCFDAELPADAALVKASWLRADFDLTVPVRSTAPDALAARVGGSQDEGGWGDDGTSQASPSPSDVYTVRLTDGATFRMPAMHLVTKELRHWLWITLWWSPEPDTDFGADRPDEIRALGGPWKNYKMCVVSDFAEGDADPTGGFPTGPGSLGDALAAVHPGVGGPTWCSNQFIERGAHNAQTNCIGCHQHAGTSLLTEDVLADPARFPSFGRTRIRNNFPSDYVFAATAAPESLDAIVDAQVSYFDTIDAADAGPQ